MEAQLEGVGHTATLGGCRRLSWMEDIGHTLLQIKVPDWMQLASDWVQPLFWLGAATGAHQ